MQQLTSTTFIAILLSSMILSSCNGDRAGGKEKVLNEQEQILKQDSSKTTAGTGDLDFMKALKDKYPNEVKLLDNPVLKQRLIKMLGPGYDLMKSNWQVETPIEIENGIFYSWGMQAHSGGDPGAVLMADLNKNILYVGIRENKKEKLYAEDGSEVPQRLKDWANEQ